MARKSKKAVDLDADDDNDVEAVGTRVNRKWSKDEERLLAKIWIEIFQDKDMGNDRFEEYFWNQIVEVFNLQTDRDPRTKNMCTGKWSRINGDCQKFNAVYKHLQRRSGENEADHLENAKTNFEQRFGSKSFMYVHVWEVLKNYPKWDTEDPIDIACLEDIYMINYLKHCNRSLASIMQAQAHFQLRPPTVSPLKPLSINSLPLVLFKSPSRIITKSRPIFASYLTAPKREKDAKKRVVITGMGLVSVFGNEVDTFYERLLSGESGISLIDCFDTSELTTKFAGQIRGFQSNGYIERKNDKRLDDCQRYCVVAGKKALEDAALGDHELSKIHKERAGVLVGSAFGGATVFSDGVESLNMRGYHKISPFLTPFVMPNMGSALLAIDLGFSGPNYSILAACASSNYCFCAAASHIREGKADLMIAGGVEASVIPIIMGGFAACRALSRRNDDPRTASRPWDKDRDGFVMGEGAGVLVMESLEHAMKRDAPILAEYLGGAINCDAYHITNPQSSGLGVSACIRSGLVDASVSVEEVNYINAHATSTLVGDLAEVYALKKVFKSTEGIKINSTKSMIGHCMGAAGALEAIATIKAIQTGWLHPTINQFDREPAVDFDIVANQKHKHEINVAISNSFGIGGHNSVVAFSAFKP